MSYSLAYLLLLIACLCLSPLVSIPCHRTQSVVQQPICTNSRHFLNFRLRGVDHSKPGLYNLRGIMLCIRQIHVSLRPKKLRLISIVAWLSSHVFISQFLMTFCAEYSSIASQLKCQQYIFLLIVQGP